MSTIGTRTVGALVVALAMSLTAAATLRAEEANDDPDAPAPRDRERPRADGRRPHPDGPRHGRNRRDRAFDERRKHPRDHMRPLTEEQIEERLEILRQIHPEMADRIDRMMAQRRERPDDHRIGQRLRGPLAHVERLLKMKRDDPRAFELTLQDRKLDRECRELASRLRKSTDVDEGDQDKLRELVSKHFDVRQQLREHKLTRLEERVRKLRETLEDRRNRRSELERQQFEILTGELERPLW